MADELFITYHNTQTPVLLIDASGSTVGNYFNNVQVLDKMRDVIKDLPWDQFRVIFWNSANDKQDSETKFPKGIYVLPFVVKKNTLDQTFAFVKPSIKNNCLTYPHLGFDAILDEWISNVEQTNVFLVTDGEIGYGNIMPAALREVKQQLSDSITKMFKKYPRVQLSIITVEPRNVNFNQVEALASAAGCDVYRVIMENKLTGCITKFISYTPNNLGGFVHINKNIPPKGFIPYGEKCFSELNIGRFIQFIYKEIRECKDDDSLLKIVQQLSSTICQLTKDKPMRVKNDIINTFCGLFNGTTLDMMFVRFIITEAVQKEFEGTANVYAQYRARLQDLYKQANTLLLSNVKDATKIDDQFMTLPLGNKIVSGNHRIIDRLVNINGNNYPQSAIRLSNVNVPVLPMVSGGTLMSEQCLRQWVRLLVGKTYNLDVMGDTIIFTVLGIVLQVVASDVPPKIKKAYQNLGHVMLKKKRLNSDRTELDRIEGGELPIPNSGKIDGFYKFMELVNRQLNMKYSYLTTWYLLCLALNNKTLIDNQFIHCKDAISKDYPNVPPAELITKVHFEISHVELPHEMVLDYNCLITLENIEKVGGYKFLPHESLAQNICEPIYILSDEGYKQLIAQKTPVCPICYTNLTADCFEKVGPKPDICLEDIKITDVFALVPAASSGSSSNNNNNDRRVFNRVPPRANSMLVIMKGVVGSGKTTFTDLLSAECSKSKVVCIVVGTDKYCKEGYTFPDAITKVKETLLGINDLPQSDRVIVCIDTCGENSGTFGVNFDGWQTKNVWVNLERKFLGDYLAWSLRNVLKRDPVSGECNYWLNPEGAGVAKCIEVHTKKARFLFGKKTVPALGHMTDKDKAINLLNEQADRYGVYLAQNENKNLTLIQDILNV
jgi:hypothetical protein